MRLIFIYCRIRSSHFYDNIHLYSLKVSSLLITVNYGWADWYRKHSISTILTIFQQYRYSFFYIGHSWYYYTVYLVCSAQNSFWKCPAETSGQNNIWTANCEFCPENQRCTHLWLMRYRSNPLVHDCFWLIINPTVRLLVCIILMNNETICSVKCNFVRTKNQNVQKMANWWMLFRALCLLLLHMCKHINFHSASTFLNDKIWHLSNHLYYVHTQYQVSV